MTKIKLVTDKAESPLKVLEDRVWDANKAFNDRNTIAGSHRIWATTFPENFKEENMRDSIEHLKLVGEAFKELQMASLALYRYLMVFDVRGQEKEVDDD